MDSYFDELDRRRGLLAPREQYYFDMFVEPGGRVDFTGIAHAFAELEKQIGKDVPNED